MKLLSVRVDGQLILLETDEKQQIPKSLATESAEGLKPVVNVVDLPDQFEHIKTAITAVASSLHESITRIPKASKVQIEFGVKLVGEVGVPLLTKASSETALKVTVEWASEG